MLQINKTVRLIKKKPQFLLYGVYKTHLKHKDLEDLKGQKKMYEASN